MNKAGISVIICCYNSEDRITQTLNYLIKQSVSPKLNWEIVIVDNQSQDNTLAISESVLRNSGIPYNIVKESRQGLIFARETGILNAKYEYLIFCDDDNWLFTNYVETAFTLMSTKSEIGAIGAQGIGTTNGTLPEWFEPYKERYAVGKQAHFSGDITDRGYIWGAAMVVRRSLLQKAFLEVPLLLQGRSGKKTTAGDDSEICKRIILMGYRLYYDEELKFYHFIPPNRLTKEYCQRLYDGFMEADKVLKQYSDYIFMLQKGKVYMLRSLIVSIAKRLLSFGYKSPAWDLTQEKNRFYFLTGIGYKGMDKSTREIRLFKKKFATL